MDSSLNGFIQEECHKDIDQQYTNDGWQYFCKQKGNIITKVSLRSVYTSKLKCGQNRNDFNYFMPIITLIHS